jgi:hypothetical protein
VMKVGRGTCLLLLAMLVATAGLPRAAHATMYDIFYTLDPATALTRPDTANGWIPGPVNYDQNTWFDLGSQQGVWFGVDNVWRPAMVKTGYFQVSATEIDSLAWATTDDSHGYEYVQGDQPLEPLPTKTWSSWSQVPTNAYTVEVDFVIYPQPSWEWIKLTNPASTTRTINSSSAFAVCKPVPEPASMGLLAVAGLGIAGMLKRRRSK